MLTESVDDKAVAVYDKLLNLQEGSGLALLGQGQLKLKEKQYLEAKKTAFERVRSSSIENETMICFKYAVALVSRSYEYDYRVCSHECGLRN